MSREGYKQYTEMLKWMKIKFLWWYYWVMEVMTIGWGYGRRWIGWFFIRITNLFIKGYYLQCTNFLSLINKELLAASPASTVHTFRNMREREIKIVLILTWVSSSLAPWQILYWLDGWGGQKILVQTFWGWKVAEVQRKGVLVGIVKMILQTSKGGIGRWKLPQVEKPNFGGDCRDGSMHK